MGHPYINCHFGWPNICKKEPHLYFFISHNLKKKVFDTMFIMVQYPDYWVSMQEAVP